MQTTTTTCELPADPGVFVADTRRGAALGTRAPAGCVWRDNRVEVDCPTLMANPQDPRGGWCDCTVPSPSDPRYLAYLTEGHEGPERAMWARNRLDDLPPAATDPQVCGPRWCNDPAHLSRAACYHKLAANHRRSDLRGDYPGYDRGADGDVFDADWMRYGDPQ